MKSRYSLLEVGITIFLFGLSMILLPSVFENSENWNLQYPDNIYTGIILMIVGSILLLIKYYNEKKGKK